LAGALMKWLRQEPPRGNVLITGGGVWADEVRALERSGQLSSESAHWLAIRTMKLTGWLLCQMLPWGTFTDQLEAVSDPRRWAQMAAEPVVFDPESFLREVEPHLPPQALPLGWQVTSDSIAARLAEVLAADELVLMKSREAPRSNLEEAANEGLVDAYFPQAAARLPGLRWVYLRDRLQQ
jgi:aspartokinase-like uncharacterized kinase